MTAGILQAPTAWHPCTRPTMTMTTTTTITTTKNPLKISWSVLTFLPPMHASPGRFLDDQFSLSWRGSAVASSLRRMSLPRGSSDPFVTRARPKDTWMEGNLGKCLIARVVGTRGSEPATGRPPRPARRPTSTFYGGVRTDSVQVRRGRRPSCSASLQGRRFTIPTVWWMPGGRGAAASAKTGGRERCGRIHD